MDGPSLHVLLVEDEAADALRVQRSLRLTEAGAPRYRLRHARTLGAGLEELQRGPVDALLLDLGLPDSDGAHTVEEIRLRHVDVPVVVLTGAEDPGLAARAFAAGADEYLAKQDLGAALLRRTIGHAIERRRGRPPSAGPVRGGDLERPGSERALWHHLKNLHTCIVGNAQLLQRELGEREFLGERARALLGAARNALALTQRLLEGATAPELPVELGGLVREAEPLLRSLLPEAIELRLDLDERPQWVGVPAEELRCVLLELVRNAAEAIVARPGRIEVRTGRSASGDTSLPGLVPAGGLRPGPHLWLEVCDTGAGLDPGELSRLLAEGYTTKGAGRGHGLHTLAGILSERRGALQVTSRPGRGATFRLLLPSIDPERPADGPARG